MNFLARAIHQTTRPKSSRNQLPFSFGVHQLRHSDWRTRSFATTTNGLERESLILYRKLLRLCRDIDSDIPLETLYQDFAIEPPLVDAMTPWDQIINTCRVLGASNWVIFPEGARYDKDLQSIKIPLRSSTDIRNLVRGLYRIHARADVDKDVLQERVAMTVQAVEHLKTHSEIAKEFQSSRARHLDRTGVAFRVGQVVQHKVDRWRGIVVGWDRVNPLPEGRLTSVTTKDYAIPEELKSELGGCQIRYCVKFDSSDAWDSDSDTYECRELQYVFQSELHPVTDGCICRVQDDEFNTYFDRYDTNSKSFVPSKRIQYQHPLDTDTIALEVDLEEREALCAGVSQAIQRFAARLERRVLVWACMNETVLEIARPTLLMVRAMRVGDSPEDGKRLAMSTLAIRQLDRLLIFSEHVGNALQRRRIASEVIDHLHFRVGDIVQNKVQGFRGIVVAWEGTRVSDADVFKLDEDPKETLLYVVFLDKSGKEKFKVDFPSGFAFQFQDDIEKCPVQTTLNMDFGGQAWEKDETKGRYMVPAHFRFGYGEKCADFEMAERTCMGLFMEVNNLNMSQQGSANYVDDELQQIGATLSIDVLLRWLTLADMKSAKSIKESIARVWLAHPNPTLRTSLENGFQGLWQIHVRRTLNAAEKVVLEDPTYGEAWYLMAMCFISLGKTEAALVAANKAVELNPRHFKAMGVQGALYLSLNQSTLAAQILQESVKLDPWSPMVAQALSKAWYEIHSARVGSPQ